MYPIVLTHAARINTARTAETEKVLGLDLGAGAPLIWSADGRSILATGTKDDKSGLYRIDTTTGDVKLVQEGGLAEASSDGRFVWRVTRPSAIVRIDTGTKEEKAIFTGPPEETLRGLRLSPDGRRLAFIQGSRRLNVVSSDGGNATELVSCPGDFVRADAAGRICVSPAEGLG